MSGDPTAIIEADVQAILAGKRYPPRGYTEEFRIPEDVSTKIALEKYGIDAYDGKKYQTNMEIDDTDAIVEADVQAILAGKRYPPRGYTEEFRIPEDVSTKIALEKYGIDAYDGNKYGKSS